MVAPVLAEFDAMKAVEHVKDVQLIGDILTMNTLTMIIVGVLFVLFMTWVANKVATGPESQGNERYVTKGKLGQLVEVIVLYMRDTVIRPQLGHRAETFTPFLLTLFFFILALNLVGLIPLMDIQHLIGGVTGMHFPTFIGGTATGRLGVTAGLAVLAFILWQINGLRQNGIKGWALHFTGGAPWYVAPIMVPVEILGMFVKPFALAVRLFANMTAGHVLLAVLIMFITAGFGALANMGPVAQYGGGTLIAVISVASAVAITFLELFVAFLQAFIFMFLTTLFIAQLEHHHHDEHHGAEEHDLDHPMTEDEAIPMTA
ncbi:MAG: F0F1 ATP synthase subunit A [Phycisphaerales bacterium]|nr:F0F1 ATP synthase subunit A [Phycisphaerales bacterium]